MKLVIYTQYDDYCNFWDEIRFIEYSSAEKFLCDFEDWCKEVGEFSNKGFLGIGLYPQNLKGTEQHTAVEVFTLDEWWNRNYTTVEEK